jgi:predicted CopG family antitoxin
MITTISVSKDTRDELKTYGNKGDSYDDIIEKLMDEYDE